MSRFLAFSLMLAMAIAQPLAGARAPIAPAGVHVTSDSSYALYIEPSSPLGKQYKFDDPDITCWTPALKAELDRCFREIARRAPGLMARACNGEKVHLVLGRSEDVAMDTDVRIKVNRSCFNLGHKYLLETLTHELVHYADCMNFISESREWNDLIADTITQYRNKFPDSEALLNERAYQRAQRVLKDAQLPSDYAAENSSEALAEITCTMIVDGFKPKPQIAAFIQKNLLSEPTGIDQNCLLMRTAVRALNAGQYNRTIALCTELIRCNPRSVSSHSILADAWAGLNETELAVYEWKQSLRRMTSNHVPSYDAEFERIYDNVQDATEQLAIAGKTRGIKTGY